MKRSVLIRGLNTQPSYVDGDCAELENVRFEGEGGALRPVAPCGVYDALCYFTTRPDLIFRFDLEKEEFFLGTVYDKASAQTRLHLCGTAVITGFEELFVPGRVCEIAKIGYLLSYVTAEGCYYGLLKETGEVKDADGSAHTTYKADYLGAIPDLPPLHIGFVNEQVLLPDAGDEMTILNVNKDDSAAEMMSQIDPVINKLLADFGEKEDKLVLSDAHFVRYALRTYDERYVKVSPPILVMPPRKANDEINVNWISETGVGTLRKLFSGEYPGLDYSNYSKLIHIHSFEDIHMKCCAGVRTYDLAFSVDLSGFPSEWTDVIAGMDVFMSLPLGVTGIKNYREDITPETVIKKGSVWPPVGVFCHPAGKLKADVLEGVRECSLFYKIRSIELKGESSKHQFVFPNSDSPIKTFEQLATQPRLEEEVSMHSFGGTSLLNFNNRLHLYGIAERYFKGYSYDFFAYESLYNGDPIPLFPKKEKIWLVTEFEDSDKRKVAEVSKGEFDTVFSTAFLSYPDARAKRITFCKRGNPAGYYPLKSRDGHVLSFDLKPHVSLNLAYYVHPDLKIISGSVEAFDYLIPYSSSGYHGVSDSLMVSETNNPLFYPLSNRYKFSGKIQFAAVNRLSVSERNFGLYPLYVYTDKDTYMMGTGVEHAYTDVSVVSNTKIASSPHYANTLYGIVYLSDDGITLYDGVGTRVLSDKIRNMQPDQPFETVFVGGKDYKLGCRMEDYHYYYRHVKGIVYNHLEEEAVFVGDDFHFVYSFKSDFIYKSTDKISLKVRNGEKNVLVAEHYAEPRPPIGLSLGKQDDVYCSIKSLLVKDYKLVVEHPSLAGKANYVYSRARFSVVTRPLLFGSERTKRLCRMLLRGKLFDLHRDATSEYDQAFLSLYGSQDGERYVLLRRFTLRENRQGVSYSDFDSGFLPKGTYRSFVVAIRGEVADKSSVRSLDFEVDEAYPGDKMR